MLGNMNRLHRYNMAKDEPYQRYSEKPDATGAFGKVYKARRKPANLLQSVWSSFWNTEELIAIKDIKYRTSQQKTQIEREIKLLSSCDHPNIIKLVEAYCIDDWKYRNVICLATAPYAEPSFQDFLDNLDGPDIVNLNPWYSKGKLLPWPSIMLGCLSGLDYLHTSIPPIRHRDLKPGNILFHRDPKLRKVVPIIIDFGISKQFLDSQWTTVSGTEQYKAPEQIPDDGRKYEDKILSLTTDIFSLGCCFALMEAVLRGKPSPRSHLAR